MLPLPDLVRNYVQHGLYARALFEQVEAGCLSLLRSMPDLWYYDGQRDDDAITALSDDVFFTCDRIVLSSFPFLGRIPFPCYVEEDFDSKTIRYHTFFSRMSIARQSMRRDLRRRCARDPGTRRRVRVYTLVGRALERLADLAGGRSGAGQSATRHGSRALWSLKDTPPLRAVVRPDQVRDRLRAVALVHDEQKDVEALVRAALLALGLATRGQLTELVLDVLPPPPAPPGDNPGGVQRGDDPDSVGVPVAVTSPGSPLDRLAVRDAVLEGHRGLSPRERTLLNWISQGLTYPEIIARAPDLRDPAAVSTRLAAINRKLMAPLVARLGGEPVDGAGQRELAELILGVLHAISPDHAERPQ